MHIARFPSANIANRMSTISSWDSPVSNIFAGVLQSFSFLPISWQRNGFFLFWLACPWLLLKLIDLPVSIYPLTFEKYHLRWLCDLLKRGRQELLPALAVSSLCYVIPSTETPSPFLVWLTPWSLEHSSDKLQKHPHTYLPAGLAALAVFPLSQPSPAILCNCWLMCHLPAIDCELFKGISVNIYNV